jgi:hypothetical protein
VQQLDRYEAVAGIAVRHGPEPAADVRAFDAYQVMANLGPQDRPCAAAPLSGAEAQTSASIISRVTVQ